MGLTTRRSTRLVFGLLALVLLAALLDAAQLWRATRINAQIASGEAIADVPGQPPEVRFAQAHALARGGGSRADPASASAAAWPASGPASAPAGANGARDAALNRYRALQADPKLGSAARYNSANLLVRQAVDVRASTQPGQAIALLELAKEYYRDVLREDPSQWDARYNLERAQRLLPDPEEEDNAPPGAERNRERAVTTMRGYSPGLP
jgi:mxaK protein